MDVDGLVLQEDVLVLVDGDDHALFGELVDGAGLGTATSMPDCSTGAVSMKMSSSTSTTSTSGVMLISASAVCVRPFAEKAMVRRSSGGLLRRLRRCCGGVSMAAFSMALSSSRPKSSMRAANSRRRGGELVVADDGGDGDDEAGGGGDEGFGDAGSDGAEGGGAGGAEAVEGVDDAHDGAEEADEGSALRRWWRARSCGVSMAVSDSEEAVWAARSRAMGLRGRPRPPVWRWYSSWISCEDGDEGAGLELVGDGGDLGEAAGFAEGAEEALGSGVGLAEARPLGDA